MSCKRIFFAFRCTSLVSIFVLISTFSAFAQGTMDAEPSKGTRCFATDPEPYAFLETVEKNLVTSNVPPNNATILGTVKPNGSPENVSIMQSSGNAQFDAECLEAILCSVRTDTNPMTLHGVWLLSHDRSHKLKTKIHNKNSITVFRIPICVLRLYPGVFSEQELLSKNNFRALNNRSSTNRAQLTGSEIKEICAYFSNWNEFFQRNSNATKALLLTEANLLENKSKREVSNLPLRLN